MRKFMALATALLLVLVLIGCNNGATPTTSIDTESPDTTALNKLLPTELISILRSPNLTGEAFIETYSDKQETTLPDATETVSTTEEAPPFAEDFSVEINYPQFKNMENPQVEENLNTLVKNEVAGFVEKHRIDNTKIDLRVNGEVTLFSENLISMVFRGSYNFEFSAHPANVIFTLNLVPNTAASFKLTDYITFDENLLSELVKLPLDDSELENTVAIAQSLTEADFKDDTLQRLTNIDLENSSTYSYYTPDSLVIILPVAHVYGDYFEYAIPC